jgi:chemotaxis family two-component system response regulator Rcp1
MYPFHSHAIRLLLVEDSPSDVWLMKEALRLAKVRVHLTLVKDGLEASRYLHRVESDGVDGPDLVLLDLNLPRRNGREVLADIKRSEVLRTIPVLIFSSSDSDEDRQQAYRLKAEGFMTKPTGLPEYVEMVKGMEKFWAGNAELRATA